MLASTALLAALCACQAAAAALGKQSQKPACVQKCWDYTQYVSMCMGDHDCLCQDSEFQNAVFQCLYSQCPTANFATALHHTLAICQGGSRGGQLQQLPPEIPQQPDDGFIQPMQVVQFEPQQQQPALLRQDHEHLHEKRQQMPMQSVSASNSGSVTRSAGPSVTRSAAQSVNRSNVGSVTRSAQGSVTRSAMGSVVRSAGPSVMRSAMGSVTRSAGPSVTRSAMQSVNRSAQGSVGRGSASVTRSQGSQVRGSATRSAQGSAATSMPMISEISDHQPQAPPTAMSAMPTAGVFARMQSLNHNRRRRA